MPIYEFYCRDCHTLFNFLSSRVNTVKRPACPGCGRPELDRQVSLFTCSLGQVENVAENGTGTLDEHQLERAMSALAGEATDLDEEDPRQMARIMRRLGKATGMTFGDGMEEAIHRLEAGEDPEIIEQQMGDLFEGDQPFTTEKVRGRQRRLALPAHDDTLYPL